MTSYRRLSENDLVSLIRDRDAAALSEIYERYSRPLLKFALTKLRNEQDAEDVVHDVFMKIWQRNSDFHIKSSLSSYLHVAVRSTIIDKLRHTQYFDKYLSSLESSVLKTEPVTEMTVFENEDLHHSLQLLSGSAREVFKLSRVDHFSTKEISQKMNMNEQSVKNSISRAMKVLRGKLTGILLLIAALIAY